LHASDNPWPLGGAVEAGPGFLGLLDDFACHDTGGPVRHAAIWAHSPMADGGEDALDRVRRAQRFPMVGRELMEGEEPRNPHPVRSFSSRLRSSFIWRRRSPRIGRRRFRSRPDLAKRPSQPQCAVGDLQFEG
jgi:hypothetical protein